MELDEWFLAVSERGNRATEIDRRHGDGTAWSEGNDGSVLIDGAAYFTRLHEVLCRAEAGDWVYFTDWQGDPDEELAGPGTAIGDVIAELARRGVNVRGLLWRSHPEAVNFGEGKSLSFSRVVNDAGGQVLLDHRVRRGGSHHQKLFVVWRDDPARDVAFVGGIDLCHGRRDDARHQGDPQVVELHDEH
jgi:phosphatidylserine/phosphatidylglycerophosphate/cardiolipin synthase-like enzyme